MKKSKIILPLIVFLFAVVAAFGTKSGKESSDVSYYWRDVTLPPAEQCVECSTPVSDADQNCSPDNEEEVCMCEQINEPLGISDDETQSCRLVFRKLE